MSVWENLVNHSATPLALSPIGCSQFPWPPLFCGSALSKLYCHSHPNHSSCIWVTNIWKRLNLMLFKTGYVWMAETIEYCEFSFICCFANTAAFYVLFHSKSFYADVEVSNQPLLNSRCRWHSFTLQWGSLSVQHTYYNVSTTNI